MKRFVSVVFFLMLLISNLPAEVFNNKQVIKVLFVYDDDLLKKTSLLEIQNQTNDMAKHANKVFENCDIPMQVSSKVYKSLTSRSKLANYQSVYDTDFLQSIMEGKVWEDVSTIKKNEKHDFVFVMSGFNKPLNNQPCFTLASFGKKIYQDYEKKTLIAELPSNENFGKYAYAYMDYFIAKDIRNVFIHELGHLLGAAHDRYTFGNQKATPLRPYAYGTYDRFFATVMGYPYANGLFTNWLPYFSMKKTVKYLNGNTEASTLIGTDANLPNARNNVALINEFVSIYPKFRNDQSLATFSNINTTDAFLFTALPTEKITDTKYKYASDHLAYDPVAYFVGYDYGGVYTKKLKMNNMFGDKVLKGRYRLIADVMLSVGCYEDDELTIPIACNRTVSSSDAQIDFKLKTSKQDYKIGNIWKGTFSTADPHTYSSRAYSNIVTIDIGTFELDPSNEYLNNIEITAYGLRDYNEVSAFSIHNLRVFYDEPITDEVMNFKGISATTMEYYNSLIKSYEKVHIYVYKGIGEGVCKLDIDWGDGFSTALEGPLTKGSHYENLTGANWGVKMVKLMGTCNGIRAPLEELGTIDLPRIPAFDKLPDISLNYSQSTGGLNVKTTNESGWISKIYINYGDGTDAIVTEEEKYLNYGISPKHIYSKPGQYTIQVTAYGANSDLQTIKTLPITIILENGTPDIDFTMDKISETEMDVTYQFSAYNKKPLTGEIVEYNWYNFDQSSITSANPIITFAKGTCYTNRWGYIKLSGKVENGEEFLAETGFDIANAKYDITVKPNKTSATTSSLIEFTYTTSPCIYIDDFDWDFGDGTFKYFNIGEKVSHQYRKPGEYIVRVKPSNALLELDDTYDWKFVCVITVKANLTPILNLLLD